jgi:glycosyltransferase involved in cell wall biosynthesis
LDQKYFQGKALMVKKILSEKVVVLSTNSSWTLLHFRLELIQALRSCGIRLIVGAPEDEFSTELRKLGIDFVEIPVSSGGLKIFDELKALFAYLRVYRKVRPDLVHHFSAKPMLIGTFAARICGVGSIVNTLTGLGHAYSKEGGLRSKLVNKLTQQLFFGRVQVTFQNPSDQQYFVENNLIKPNQAHLILGSGINTKKFRPVEGEVETPPVQFLMFSRMIREKGVYEYVAAAKSLAQKHGSEKCRFTLIGGTDDKNLSGISSEWLDNPSNLSQPELNALVTADGVNWMPHQDPMLPHILEANVIVLPSYYPEGVPRSLLEGLACGKALITTDLPGCREVIRENKNGFLVAARSSVSLEEAMERFIATPQLAADFGEVSRSLAVERFADEIVIQKTLKVYNSVLLRKVEDER